MPLIRFLTHTLVTMGLQDDAALRLSEALVKHHLGIRIAHGMTPSVTITEHPGAVVYFKVDHLGGLVTEFVFDGRPPVRLDYLPTAAGADALAEYILEQIAGEGGRAPT
jgi:hypothetical protein